MYARFLITLSGIAENHTETLLMSLHMKYYQTSFKDYLQENKRSDIHPHIKPNDKFIPHTIMYGPSGSGKYTQALKLIEKYSPSLLKYEKSIICSNDKTEYVYKMSDIHFEIDMSILGCNAKQLWNDIFLQIIEIIAIRTDKRAILICKNFQSIHGELLDMFYNYIQQSRNNMYNIQLSFILLTDSIGFIPYNIIKSCKQICLESPNTKALRAVVENNNDTDLAKRTYGRQLKRRICNVLAKHESITVTNLKELYSLDSASDSDLFNTLCDTLINDILSFDTNSDYILFREHLYDILTYDINLCECLFYILENLTYGGYITGNACSVVLHNIYSRLMQYNNNYRPIYHLENMFYEIILAIHGNKGGM
jgi:hypothetical protein